MKLNIQLFAEGKVVIETELDTKGFEKGVKQISKKNVEVDVEPKIDKHFYDVLYDLSDDEKAMLKVGVEIEEKDFDKIKEDYKEKVKELSNEELLKLHTQLDIDSNEISKQFREIEKKQEEIQSRNVTAIPHYGPLGISGYSYDEHWVKEDVIEYQKLENEMAVLDNEYQSILSKNIAIREILEDQIPEIDHWKDGVMKLHSGLEIVKKDELDLLTNGGLYSDDNFELDVLTDNMNKLIQDFEILQSKKIFSDKDLETAEELRKEITYLASQIGEITGSPVHIKGITDVKNDLEDIDRKTNNIGKSITNVIKKVGKWALAIFGIRSAYMFIRQQMGVLSQYNEKIGADIEYMRWAIANALKPVIEKIIQLAYTLLVYIGYIIKRLFGINIFANASAKAFERQKKALSGSNKEAKQLEKTLAGFDEMNIIQESGNATRGGGGGGVSLPTQDLADMLEKIKIPDWLVKLTDWLVKLKDYIVENWDWLWKLGVALATVFAIGKINGWLSNIAKLIGASGTASTVGTGLAGLLSTLLLIAAIGAIVVEISVIGNDVKELSNDMDEINNKGLKGYKKNVDEVKKGERDIGDILKANNIHRAEGLNQLKMSQDLHYKILGLSDDMLNTSINVAREGQYAAKTEFELYKNKKLTKEQQQQVVNDLKAQKQYLVDLLPIMVAEGMNTQEIEKYLVQINDALNYTSPMFGGIAQKIEEAKDQSSALNDNVGWLNQQKIADKIVKFDLLFDTSSANNSLSRFASNITTKLNSALSNVNMKQMASNMVNLLSKIPGFNTSTLKKAFGLAKGGIVNLPGRGVPIGNAYTGEAGREGVIPLTDSQQMSLLGEAIGKYIRIDNVIDVNMDSRKIKRIMATSDSRDRMVGNG